MKYVLNICVGAVLLLAACKKDAVMWQVQNLNPNNQTFAFGHGGMGVKYRYPMNSMQSLKHILAIGADGTEMDLQLSQDNVMVLFHNNFLQDASNGKGAVRDKTWDEIKNVNYTFPLFGNSKLIRFQDYFDEIGFNNKHIFTFDCKVEANEDADYLNNFVKCLYDLIVKYHLEQNCFIESYNVEFLKALYLKNPQLKLFVHSNNLNDGLAVAQQVKLYGLTLDRLKITKEEIALAHQNNLHVTLYNMVNESENLKAIQMNADFLQGDKMEHLIKVVKKN